MAAKSQREYRVTLQKALPQVDLPDLIRHYYPDVHMKRAGQGYRCTAVWRGGRNQGSVSIYKKEGMWVFNDFGGGIGGSAYRFLTDICGLSKGDAAKETYRWAGITNPYGTNQAPSVSSNDIQAHLAQARLLREAEEKKEKEERRQRFERKCIGLQRLSRTGPSAYLERKGLGEITSDDVAMRFGRNKEGVPFIALTIQDVAGNIRAIQKIYDQKVRSGKIENATDRKFEWGGEKKGYYLVIGDTTALEQSMKPTVIVVCEGFSTGASIYLAFGKRLPVFCALDAGNLAPVAQNLLQHYCNSEILFAADNDQWKEHNTGLSSARLAALAHYGMVATPDFTGLDVTSKPTDFNDLHQLGGFKQVRGSIGAAQQVNDPTVAELAAILNPDEVKPFIHPAEKKMLDFKSAAFAVEYFIQNPEQEIALPVLKAAYDALAPQVPVIDS